MQVLDGKVYRYIKKRDRSPVIAFDIQNSHADNIDSVVKLLEEHNDPISLLEHIRSQENFDKILLSIIIYTLTGNMLMNPMLNEFILIMFNDNVEQMKKDITLVTGIHNLFVHIKDSKMNYGILFDRIIRMFIMCANTMDQVKYNNEYKESEKNKPEKLQFH